MTFCSRSEGYEDLSPQALDSFPVSEDDLDLHRELAELSEMDHTTYPTEPVDDGEGSTRPSSGTELGGIQRTPSISGEIQQDSRLSQNADDESHQNLTNQEQESRNFVSGSETVTAEEIIDSDNRFSGQDQTTDYHASDPGYNIQGSTHAQEGELHHQVVSESEQGLQQIAPEQQVELHQNDANEEDGSTQKIVAEEAHVLHHMDHMVPHASNETPDTNQNGYQRLSDREGNTYPNEYQRLSGQEDVNPDLAVVPRWAN